MATLRDYLETRVALPTSFSPDGENVLVLSDLTGTMQLHTVPRPGGEPMRLTSFREPVGGVFIPQGGGRILLQMDEGGNERLQLYVLDPAQADGDGLRKLVYAPEFIHRPGGVTLDGTQFAYGCNRRNGVDFDVYVGPLERPDDAPADGSLDRCVFSPGGWCEPVGFSPDGRWLAVLRPTDRPGDNDLYLVDVVDGEVVHASPHTGEAFFGPPAWLADSSGFHFATSEARDTAGIARYDLASRSWRYVIETGWDLACFADCAGRRLLVEANEDGYTRLELRDPDSLAVRGEIPLPGRGVVTSRAFSFDGRRLAYGFTSPIEPGDVWLFDTETGETTRLTDSPKPVPSSELVEPDLHRFASFDGEQIPAFLFTPRSGEPPTPVVAWIHGGPESQFRPTFNPVLQYFVAQGYAVAGPNVRGSTGYGKRFEHLDDVRLRLDSVRDLAALHDWIASLDELDETRAVLVGGSYGGYMVLAGLAFQPERWAAGIDVVGVSSLVTFLENTAAWRRKVREPEYGSLERDYDFLVEASPLTHIERITAPLFIIHGANDPRVPLGEAEQIFDELCRRGIRCDLAVYADEGHGLAKLPNRIDAFTKAIEFLAEVLRR